MCLVLKRHIKTFLPIVCALSLPWYTYIYQKNREGDLSTLLPFSLSTFYPSTLLPFYLLPFYLLPSNFYPSTLLPFYRTMSIQSKVKRSTTLLPLVLALLVCSQSLWYVCVRMCAYVCVGGERERERKICLFLKRGGGAVN